jgi:hypothetical protein
MTVCLDILAIVAALSIAVIFGTDMVGAMVMRRAYAEVDDYALVQVAGRSHHWGGRRMAIPGITSVIATAATGAVAFATGHAPAGTIAAIGLACLLAWLALFNRVSLPINKQLIAATETGEIPTNARDLQRRWDSIVVLRATLQGTALLGVCLVLAIAGH